MEATPCTESAVFTRQFIEAHQILVDNAMSDSSIEPEASTLYNVYRIMCSVLKQLTPLQDENLTTLLLICLLSEQHGLSLPKGFSSSALLQL